MTTIDHEHGVVPNPGSVAIDTYDYFAQDAARKKLAEELRPANKAALFDALSAASIAFVLVSFDGCGDSGQIEAIVAFDDAGEPMALPQATIELAFPQFAGTGVDHQTLPVEGAIETFVYDLLEQTLGGWENNEGAYGEFTFSVADRAIRLDYNQRIETSEHFGHEF